MLAVRVYCDRHESHVGNPFPPDCRACDVLSAEWAALSSIICPDHPWCLKPCEKCESTEQGKTSE